MSPFLDSAPACSACGGTLIGSDKDGSITGTLGAVIPCECLDADLGTSTVCPCFIADWPLNDGFTGWTLCPLAELSDTAPFLRPCPTHNASTLRVTSPMAVAA